ncbi:hypothetical protein RKLH11_4035 [Rhodobacteraceae bacterium KLH11]|nr:hypothetical protein RKLH11_4035 [Rhodobacteraceae bacterium KLH11]
MASDIGVRDPRARFRPRRRLTPSFTGKIEVFVGNNIRVAVR